MVFCKKTKPRTLGERGVEHFSNQLFKTFHLCVISTRVKRNSLVKHFFGAILHYFGYFASYFFSLFSNGLYRLFGVFYLAFVG